MEDEELDFLLCIEEDQISIYIPHYNLGKLPGFFYAKDKKLNDPRLKIAKF